MTHPSPTAYPEREIFRHGRYAQCQVVTSWKDKPPKYIACYEPERGDHFVAKQALGTWCEVELSEVLSYIAALEADYQRMYLKASENLEAMLDERKRAEKAEAQLATRLPTEAQISYLLEVLAREGVANDGGDFMRRKISKAILALLSGAATAEQPYDPGHFCQHCFGDGKHAERCPMVATPAPTAALTEAARDVLAERQRQVSTEGWSHIHDDAHAQGELASAAACYAMGERLFRPMSHHNGFPDLHAIWPWDPAWWKPTTPRRNLVKAAALLLAEIERHDRAKSPPQGAEE